jgi:hypothetical protein
MKNRRIAVILQGSSPKLALQLVTSQHLTGVFAVLKHRDLNRIVFGVREGGRR